jgi:hypothetical protein
MRPSVMASIETGGKGYRYAKLAPTAFFILSFIIT